MYCSNCGKEIGRDKRFCPFCGSQQGHQAPVQAEQSAQAQNKTGWDLPVKGLNPTVKVLLSMVAVFFVVLIVFLLFISGKLKSDSSSAEKDMTVSREEDKDDEQEDARPFADGIQVGGIVTFGSYEQDGRLSNGQEPIEWDVLDEQNGWYLLVSHYVLDYQRFDNGMTDKSLRANEDESSTFVTWETCSLRKWLNSDFYSTAFSDTEQQYIVEVTNTTRDYDEMNEDDIHNLIPDWEDSVFTPFPHVKYTGKGGNPTQDKVFVLSFDDFAIYYDPTREPSLGLSSVGGFASPKSIVSPTQYAIDQGISYNTLTEVFDTESYYYVTNMEEYVGQDYVDNGNVCGWVLRSPGQAGNTVIRVEMQMFDCLSDNRAMSGYFGIRPAIWVTF